MVDGVFNVDFHAFLSALCVVNNLVVLDFVSNSSDARGGLLAASLYAWAILSQSFVQEALFEFELVWAV